MTSLKDYVENMKEDQQAIYYFSSESVKSARNAPFMEKLVERGYEVSHILAAILFYYYYMISALNILNTEKIDLTRRFCFSRNLWMRFQSTL